MSDEKSYPVFGFTQAKRGEGEKLYLGEVTKMNNIAKQSPGPIYEYQDTIKYEQVSQVDNFIRPLIIQIYSYFRIITIIHFLETSMGLRNCRKDGKDKAKV